MNFFIADTHFGHSNITSSCERPFKDIREMDKVLTDNWNSRITDRDDVWIAGDMFYRCKSSVEQRLESLKGIKHLVLGNHDHDWLKNGREKYFASINQMEIVKLDGRLVHICHYPMMEWHNSFHGSYLVFGHIHNSVSSPFLEAIAGNEHMLNAGVDLNYFQPVTFEELVKNNAEFYDRKRMEK